MKELTDFQSDTAAEAIGENRYRVTLNDRWWVSRGPNGGYVAALMLEAMTQTVAASIGDPDAQPPRSLTVHFLSPPSTGPAEIEVTVERGGRSTSYISSRLIQDGEVDAKAMAVFSAARQGPEFDHTSMPEVAAPEKGSEMDTGQGPVAVFSQYRAVPAIGGAPFSGGPLADTAGWLRLKDDQPMTPVLAAAMLDVWYPAPFACLTEPVRAPTLEYTVHFPVKLPVEGSEKPDWSLIRLTADQAAEGHFSEDGELWSRDGTLLARCRQVALLLDRR
ncbi:MAG: thioesterase family protein [Thermoleophilia bacterium]|nr:thioesterase family protein [Thermoleophilia bacterium]